MMLEEMKNDTRILAEILQKLKKWLWKWEYPTAYWQQLRQGMGIIPIHRKELALCHPIPRDLLGIFLHGKSLPIARLNELLPREMITPLLDHEILKFEDHKKRNLISTMQFIPLNSRFLLLHPYHKRIAGQHPVYLGADSLMMSRFMTAMKPPKRILDVGTGTGYLLFSLPWQDPSIHCLGIDVNPKAIEIARLNAVMNEMSWIQFSELDILNDDLESILSTRFDLIIGNLPIIPTPEDPRCKWHGRLHSDGGLDGQKYLRRTLDHVPDLLESGGMAQFLACSIGSREKPQLLDELKNWGDKEGFSVTVIALKKIPVEVDAFFRSHQNMEQYQLWMNFYHERKAEAWYRLMVRIDDQKNEDRRHHRYMEMTRTDFFNPIKEKDVDKRRVILSFPHYLLDVSFANRQVKTQDLLEQSWEIMSFINNHWKALMNCSVLEGGRMLKERFPRAFSSDGAAILAWGSCINDLNRNPRQLIRKLL